MPSQLAQCGLNIFATAPVASLPVPLREAVPAGFERSTLCLVGHGGRELWNHLPHPLDSAENPIDRFVLRQIERFQPTVLYPHSTLVYPLTQLGRYFNVARPSLVGLDIHPVFGLWFAYRAVFLTDMELPVVPAAAPFASPCETCADKPCVKACPSQAVSVDGFQLGACATYRLSENSSCLSACHSRIACPVGAGHRYSEEQLRYHMSRPAHLKKLGGCKSSV